MDLPVVCYAMTTVGRYIEMRRKGMDSQLIYDYYNLNLGVENNFKDGFSEADQQQILNFFGKHCPEILDLDLLLMSVPSTVFTTVWLFCI